MPPRVCPECGSKSITTDYSQGTVVCQDCGIEIERGILVSEIGFAEGSGGRVHVQGTFVSHHATGIHGLRGGPSSENIKEEGRKRIQMICSQMGIVPSVQRGAQRFYSLAVDNKFNRGRRTDYVVASCIYLFSRFEKDVLMLIDFSERLQINVYELGATYLKLRSALNLDQILPEIDPAVYNIRFANRLDFGNQAHVVARDASRLVKRFQADWMTAGRRPAGICGACLVIAARMSDFLRTPEEVAQVVKVSPITIKKRLMEFAQTSAAGKTVSEWRSLTDADLVAPDTAELPPIMKLTAAREIKATRIKRETGDGENDEDGEEEYYDTDSLTGAGTPRKRKRRGSADGHGDGDEVEGALRQAAAELGADGIDEDGEDLDMEPLAKEDYVVDIQQAGDNSEAAKEARNRERKRLMASLKGAHGEEIDDEALLSMVDPEGNDDDGDDDDDEEGDGDNKLKPVNGRFAALPDWNDKRAVYEFIESSFFSDEIAIYGGSRDAMWKRIDGWLQGRDPELVVGEMRCVEHARHQREVFAKTHREAEFDDLDDDELDVYWVMDEDERQARARMWLSHNGKWLEEDQERQEKKAAYNKAHGIDPNKPKPPKKRRGQGGQSGQRRGPFSSAREAIDSVASAKKFSSRINMDAFRKLAGFDESASPPDSAGLEQMDEEHYDEDEKDDKEDEYDEEELEVDQYEY